MKLLLLFLFTLGFSFVANAQIITDGSLGPPAAELPAIDGEITIDESLGRLVGTNLFHSFSEFNVNSGESATFTGPASVGNILSRVTGDNVSNINGLIKSDIEGANFFFMNPKGILFGPRARMDIGGAISFSTADYTKLEAGGRFDVANPDNSILTSAPPEAFGFLDDDIAGISVEGSFDITEPPQINTRPEQVLSIVGGDLDLTRAFIVIPGGRLNLISVASPGEAKFNSMVKEAAVDISTFENMGDITMTGFASEDFQTTIDSFIELGGEGGGSVVLRGRSLTMHFAVFNSQTFGAKNGGNIDIELQTSLKILGGSVFNTSSVSKGNGGNIFIVAENVEINRQDIPFTSGIISQTGNIEATFMDPPPQLDRGGNGGNITIQTKNLSIIGGAGIGTSSIVGGGDSGNIIINADSVLIDGIVASNDDIPLHFQLGQPLNTGISAQTLDPFNTSAGGTIAIKSEELILANRARIISDSAGLGQAGNIIIESPDSAVANKVEISNAIVSASSNSAGGGGNILVNSQSVLLDGKGNLENPVGIQAQTGGEGDGGSIAIDTNQLVIENIARISSRSTQRGSGDAGNIDITADGVLVREMASIDNSSEKSGGGGNITVNVRDNFTIDNSQVTTMSDEDGGNVTVLGDGVTRLSNSKLTAEAFFNGGNIASNSTALILDNSDVLANAIQGSGGNILVNSDVLLASQDSTIDASSRFGISGNIDILALDFDIAGSLAVLPDAFFSQEIKLQENCAIKLSADLSSFISVGRGGIPIEPGGILPAFNSGSE